MNPPPPRLSLEEYCRWISQNISRSDNIAERVLQKQIEEPPLRRPFRYIDAAERKQVGESGPHWPSDGPEAPDSDVR